MIHIIAFAIIGGIIGGIATAFVFEGVIVGLIVGVVCGIIGGRVISISKSLTVNLLFWGSIGAVAGWFLGSSFWQFNYALLGLVIGMGLGILISIAKVKKGKISYLVTGAATGFFIGIYVDAMIGSFPIVGIIGGGVGFAIAWGAYYQMNTRSISNTPSDIGTPSSTICSGCGEIISIGSKVQNLPERRVVHANMLCWKKATDQS